MLFSSLAVYLLGVSLVAAGMASFPDRQAPSSTVTWDNHSMKINGQRLMIYSAEVHGFRYPGSSSWSEVFQKLKAAGFNTVSTYFFWGMVEYKRGVFDWNGFRDPQAFFDAAKEAGLYVISRPGPYINAEVSSGGFPGWLQRVPGPARNSGDEYTKAYLPYITKIFEITARNQLTQGGPVIALQLENEYDQADGGEDFKYEGILKQAAIDAGITVPTIHNGALASAFGNYFIENVDIWGYDEYPVTKTVCPGPETWPDDAVKQFQWGMHEDPKYNRGQPMAIYEFEGGFKQKWGDAGYCGEMAGVDFQKMFNKNKFSMATTIFNIYMAWGGTNWGNLASPDVYTSYDFGAMITEDRQLRNKYYEAKVQGQFLQSSPAFLTAVPQNIDSNTMAFVASSSGNLTVTYSLDTEGGNTKFFFVRHTAASSNDNTEYSLSLPTSQGNFTIPQVKESFSLQGRDTKIHVVDYQIGKHSLLYSSAEVMTSLVVDGVTTVVLYGDAGQLHETAIVTSGFKNVQAFGDTADSVISKPMNNSLVLHYKTSGKTAVKVGDDLLVYLLDRETAYTTWPDVENNALVLGGYLIRSASSKDGQLEISGDFNETTSFEIVCPRSSKSLSVNGRHVTMASTEYGTKTATVNPVLPSISLPDLHALPWVAAAALPEISGDFDDSDWTVADLEHTTNPNTPKTPVSLYSGDYGYHSGIISWRGHFTAAGGEEQLTLDVYGGSGFGYTAYDNGTFMHSWTGKKSSPHNAATFSLPATWVAGEKHIITIVQDHMGYSMSWRANEELYKEPRGIFSYDFTSKDGATVSPEDTLWKVQGNKGGEDYIDQTRGPFNEGGLYAERSGWHLPGFPDQDWKKASPSCGVRGGGIGFYRTTFTLDIPDTVDYPISLQLPVISADRPYRAVVYINGYQFGRYASSLGPQTKFPLPPTILNRSGENTLALAVWSMSEEGASVTSLSLVIDSKLEYGGPPLKTEPAPRYAPR